MNELVTERGGEIVPVYQRVAPLPVAIVLDADGRTMAALGVLDDDAW